MRVDLGPSLRGSRSSGSVKVASNKITELLNRAPPLASSHATVDAPLGVGDLGGRMLGSRRSRDLAVVGSTSRLGINLFDPVLDGLEVGSLQNRQRKRAGLGRRRNAAYEEVLRVSHRDKDEDREEHDRDYEDDCDCSLGVGEESERSKESGPQPSADSVQDVGEADSSGMVSDAREPLKCRSQ